jgi:hypothetical protein
MKQVASKFVQMGSSGSWNILRNNELIAQSITIYWQCCNLVNRHADS